MVVSLCLDCHGRIISSVRWLFILGDSALWLFYGACLLSNDFQIYFHMFDLITEVNAVCFCSYEGASLSLFLFVVFVLHPTGGEGIPAVFAGPADICLWR